MKKVLIIFNYWVFIITTLAIAGVFYEGMALKWFNMVGVLVLLMDFSFMLSTVINLFTERKTKWIYTNIFSALLIVVAIAMKILKIEYPIITLVLWYFYIWFLYGIRIVVQYMRKNLTNDTA